MYIQFVPLNELYSLDVCFLFSGALCEQHERLSPLGRPELPHQQGVVRGGGEAGHRAVHPQLGPHPAPAHQQRAQHAQ